MSERDFPHCLMDAIEIYNKHNTNEFIKVQLIAIACKEKHNSNYL